jgi:hypothetical protein
MRKIGTNSQGQSVVQVLIAVAIMSIVMVTFAELMTNQQRQISQADQKVASIDLARFLSTILANTSVCTFMVTNPPLAAFNPVQLNTPGTSNSLKFNLTEIPATSSPGGTSGTPRVVHYTRVTIVERIVRQCHNHYRPFVRNGTLYPDKFQL